VTEGLVDDYASRHIPFERCFNFRDVGGYPTGHGDVVQWGRYFRAGAPHRMSAEDLERCRALSIASVIDLRRPDELRASGGRPPIADPPVQYHTLPVVPEGGSDLLNERYGHGISGRRYFGYLQTGPEYFRRAFEVLTDPGSYPVLVHCTAGKDRTGVLTALVLSMAGVPRPVIEADFVLTNRDVERQIARMRAEGRIPEGGDVPELGVPDRAIADFLDIVEREYGSPAGYVESLGMDAAATSEGIVEALVRRS
jgi:protein-tyrosine phosphatase